MNQGNDQHLSLSKLIEETVIAKEKLSDRRIRELWDDTAAPRNLAERARGLTDVPYEGGCVELGICSDVIGSLL